MLSLRNLALVASAVAYGAVMLGSWTRINGAGMTCPDWPLCHGQLVPSMADGTVWEWSHRLLAFCVTPLVLGVLLVAWRRRSAPGMLAAGGAIVALFLTQVLLGAATVHLGNSPISVVLHWGTAMAFIAALVSLAILTDAGHRRTRLTNQTSRCVVTALGATATIAFVTMCIGAYVSSSGAGLACLSIPTCAGTIVVYSDGQLVQMIHRIVAALTLVGGAASATLVFVLPSSVRVRAIALTGLGLIFIQVLLGLLNVALRLPMDLREAHAANAALVFLAYVAATLFAFIDTSEPARRTAVSLR